MGNLKKRQLNINLVLIWHLTSMMLLMTISRLLFFAFNLSIYPVTSAHLLSLLLGGLKFDLAAVLYTNTLYILGLLIPFKFRRNSNYQRILKWLFCITNSIALALNCIDFIYFKFTLRRTTWSVFKEFSNDIDNARLGLHFFVDYWYVVLIFITLVMALIWLYNIVRIAVPVKKNNVIYYGVGLIILIAGVGLFVAGVRGGFRYSTRPITLSNAGEYVDNPVEIGLVLNTPFSIYKTISNIPLQRQNYFASQEELQGIYNPCHYPIKDSAFRPANVVIFILESFSKEFIGAFNKNLDSGTYKGYTPFLDSLIRESKAFKWSFATGRKSIDAMPSVLASIPSIVEPFVLSNYSGNRINSIAGLLGKKGYDCSLFHGAPNGSMGFNSFAKLAGFQHYYGKTEYNNDDDFDNVWGIWDEPFFQFFAKTLNTKKTPFLGVVFSVSSHEPFKVPQKYKNTFPQGTLPIHHCIGYTDHALRQFFATVSQMPWFNNTLFVFTADHAAGTVTHDVYKTSVNAFSIPIFFYKPGSNLKGMEEDKLIFQTDIMPSILEYLHYDEPYFAFGSDVLGKAASTDHFGVNYIGCSQIYKGQYVLQANEKEATALYNYQNDPFLKTNLLQTEAGEKDSLEKLLKAFRQQYNDRMLDDKLTIK